MLAGEIEQALGRIEVGEPLGEIDGTVFRGKTRHDREDRGADSRQLAVDRRGHEPHCSSGSALPSSFTNQDGQTVTEKNMAGKVYVAEYFFTHCDGICPTMNNNMRLVYEEFKNDSNFLILSHTCDPDRDSVAQMKYYADSMKVDTKKWIFLTGRKDRCRNFMGMRGA